MSDYSGTIEKACYLIGDKDIAGASRVINNEYPFVPPQKSGRTHSPRAMTWTFARAGFIDRYRGTRLVFPPVLRLLSIYVPTEFPYQKNARMDSCHMAYWDLLPTIDHLVPVARGGAKSEENWVCCSMLTNSIKSNWTLEELQWQLFPPGDLGMWDGMVAWFVHQVANDPSVLENAYIKRWHNAAKELVEQYPVLQRQRSPTDVT